MELKGGIRTFYAKSRKEWRTWLKKYHQSEKSVWLIIYHRDGKVPSPKYDEAVEEALCFGWVDSKPNKRDKESYYLFFAQRKSKSNWSKANRVRAEKMVQQGLMTTAGLAMIELAKQTGTWTALQSVQQSIVPADLKKVFGKKKKAYDNYLAFPPSSKRIILEWIMNAKRPETRQKRIEETVALAARNIRANHYRQ